MSNRKLGFWHWFSAWFPVFLGLVVIAIESTPYLGADRTSGPLRYVFESIFGPVGDYDWAVIHFVIRKSGHFLGYGAIGVAWFRAWWMSFPRSRFLADALLALLGTAAIASTDEFHQSFLPNRTGSIRDVLLDCAGAATLQIVVYFFMRVFQPKRLSRAE